MRKLYILLLINNIWVGKMVENNRKNEKENLFENDIGFILWKLQSIEDFIPCYKTMMEREQE
jgi:hypothetical protein